MYDRNRLNVMAYTDGFTLWNYQTVDKIIGYGGGAVDDLKLYFHSIIKDGIARENDLIIAISDTNGTPTPHMLFVSKDGVIDMLTRHE